ncbi:MAG: hypothetical protein JWQ84_19 [Mucilaginibacter sp.]|nr:hypothetical protein [Mucilaginibacter sp.]MDB5138916.1 hypothetical protein [Mucilaginibacter sp.]
MENKKNGAPLDKMMEENKDDATAPSSNAAKASAAEVNRGGDPDSRNYMNKKDAGSEGPDFNKKSKGADGDTGQNAGVFK